ncbi:MAG: PA domain-containing protein, partial [Glaciihabitans sp.]
MPPESLADTVSADSVMVHLQALQDIADANGGNRAVGTAGYEASGAYIESVLEAAGYDPVRQTFQAESQQLLGYDLVVTAAADVPVAGLPMSGTTGTGPEPVTATIVQPATALGCDAAAWDGVDATGSIALVSRGECDFSSKSLAASAAGAVGLLVYNNAPGELSGTLGEQAPENVPTVGISATDGAAIVAALGTGAVSATLLLNE